MHWIMRARRPWCTQAELRLDAVRLDFDRRSMLQFRDSLVTSDAELLANSELDDVLDSYAFTRTDGMSAFESKTDGSGSQTPLGRSGMSGGILPPSHRRFHQIQKTLTVHVGFITYSTTGVSSQLVGPVSLVAMHAGAGARWIQSGNIRQSRKRP
jgi:hypothetical protein